MLPTKTLTSQLVYVDLWLKLRYSFSETVNDAHAGKVLHTTSPAPPIVQELGA